jgi:hypothetical protein
MADQKFYKDTSPNEKVTIQVPIHNIIGAVAEYGNTEWVGENVGIILGLCIRETLDPLFMKEREAAIQHQMDMARAAQEAMVSRLIQGTDAEDTL